MCVGAGTWQIVRFERQAARERLPAGERPRAPAAVGAMLPVVGGGPGAVGRDAVEFRQVRVAGHLRRRRPQTLVRSRTTATTPGSSCSPRCAPAPRRLLVVRGFVAEPGRRRADPACTLPGGPVTITARARSHRDAATTKAALQTAPPGRRRSTPREQAARLGGPVYDGYVELEAGSPAPRGPRRSADPDLSNPAGGALEPQHFAYVVQWYLFALLALAAPVVMARAGDTGSATPATSTPTTTPATTPTRPTTRGRTFPRPSRCLRPTRGSAPSRRGPRGSPTVTAARSR